jgi:hypothetical protein
LTTSIAAGVATLTNTTSYYNDTGSGGNPITQTLYPAKLNQYINVYSRTASTPATFNFSIANNSVPVGSWVSIHIDAGCPATDTYVVQAGTNTSTSPPATGAGNVTCIPGNTYTFMCFLPGVWTRA